MLVVWTLVGKTVVPLIVVVEVAGGVPEVVVAGGVPVVVVAGEVPVVVVVPSTHAMMPTVT